MFSIFKKKSALELNIQKHKDLLQKAYEMSHKNRKESDLLTAEAEKLWEQIEREKAQQKTT